MGIGSGSSLVQRHVKTVSTSRAPRRFLSLLSLLALGAALTPALPASATQIDANGLAPSTLAESSGTLVLAEPSLGLPNLSSSGMSDLVVHVEWARNEDATVTLQNAYSPNAKPYLESAIHIDRSATLVVPVDPTREYSSDLAVVVRDQGGHEVGRARVSASTRDNPVVVAMVNDESALLSLLSQARIDHRTTYGSPEVKSLTVTHPPTMGGRLRAPEHVYGYQEATVVLASDSAIAGLTDDARAALIAWVKLGGRLVLLDKHEAALPELPLASSLSSIRGASLGAGHIVTIAPNEPRASLDAVTDQVRAALDAPHNGVLTTSGRSYELDSMRRALDPNEHFRPALGAAALLLVLYSVVVGPLLYRRARRRGKPLEVLITVPGAAAIAFAMILGIGLFSKGIHGRSRRLTFVELGHGDDTGPSRIYRAFYSTRATTVSIEPATELSLPRLAVAGGNREGGETLVLTGKKSVLRDVTLPPWQAVMTTDEAVTSIDGGISLEPDAVKNGSSRALRDAIIRSADGQCTYFEEIPAHTTLKLSTGRTAGQSCTGGAFYAWELGLAVPANRRDSFVAAWTAISEQASDALFKKHQATLVAEVMGLPAPDKDSGLRVESSRTLVRVMGGAE